MNEIQLAIEVEPHPSLRPIAFETRFPSPLGETTSPKWLLEMLTPDFAAPVKRDEALRMAVRDTLRHWGHKPAGRGKPACEYLVRAIGDGKLDSINTAVDVCNAVSFHSGFPIALVDLSRADPPFRVAQGPPDQSYVFNASGQEMSLKGLICLFDSSGPCANPVKDAQRTKTNEETIRTLTVLWGVAGFEDRATAAVEWYIDLLRKVGADIRAADVESVACDGPMP